MILQQPLHLKNLYNSQQRINYPPKNNYEPQHHSFYTGQPAGWSSEGCIMADAVRDYQWREGNCTELHPWVHKLEQNARVCMWYHLFIDTPGLSMKMISKFKALRSWTMLTCFQWVYQLFNTSSHITMSWKCVGQSSTVWYFIFWLMRICAMHDIFCVCGPWWLHLRKSHPRTNISQQIKSIDVVTHF